MENKRTGTANGNPGVNQNQNVETIDLMDVFGVIGAKIRTILLSRGIVATHCLSHHPVSHRAGIFLDGEASTFSPRAHPITSLADVQMGASLTPITPRSSPSRPVIDQVIKDLDLDTDYDALSKKGDRRRIPRIRESSISRSRTGA